MTSLSRSCATALAWTFTASTLALTTGRFIIRYKILHKLQLDDALHGLAAVVLIVYIVSYTGSFSFLYPSTQPGTTELAAAAALKNFFHRVMAVSASFWVIVYSVKFSFLVFYRLLFGISRSFMAAWWIVLGYTILTFMANFIASFWSCGTPEELYDLPKCVSPHALAVSTRYVIMWCFLNVTSDVAIMALPLWMLNTLQMRTGQKIGLALLFLLVIIVIVFDVIRTIYDIRGGLVGVKTVLFDVLEPNITVIISALPTYRALFRDRPKSSRAYRNLELVGRRASRQRVANGHELSSTLVSLTKPETETSRENPNAQSSVTQTDDRMDCGNVA